MITRIESSQVKIEEWEQLLKKEKEMWDEMLKEKQKQIEVRLFYFYSNRNYKKKSRLYLQDQSPLQSIYVTHILTSK